MRSRKPQPKAESEQRLLQRAYLHVFGHDEHAKMLKHVKETMRTYTAHDVDGQ